MLVERFVVGTLATNCYLVWEETKGRSVVIDPGDDGDFVSDQIAARHLDLQAILLTHGHFDHCLGVLPLKLNFNAPVYLHQRDHGLYTRAEGSADYWQPLVPHDPLPPVDSFFPGSHPPSTLYDLQVLHTPGHTPGSVCFYLPKAGYLFTGDTLFKGSVGETRHQYSSALKLSSSLKKLSLLPPETVVYPGHGEPTTIGDEF